MATLRELKGRIGSVASTEKVTSAMKMISSAKMHKSAQALKRLLPFRNQIQSIISHLLAADGDYNSPLIEVRDVKKIAIVTFGSDDGLCGAYNINIVKNLLVQIKNVREQYGKGVKIIVYPIGGKAVKAVGKIKGVEVKEAPINTRSNREQLTEFTEMLKEQFLDHEVDAVKLLYMHFHSVSKQTIQFDQFLPVSNKDLLSKGSKKSLNRSCIFEPDANAIFGSVLPLYIMSVMQEIFTESTASEQSARVMAMQTANDNANNLLEELQLDYNKMRQQSITTELLDILGGQVER